MNFEWDLKKAATNLKKHGVSFDDAATVFADSLSATQFDREHSAREERFITMGVDQSGKLLLIAHTDRGGYIRIISARKATTAERKGYENQS